MIVLQILKKEKKNSSVPIFFRYVETIEHIIIQINQQIGKYTFFKFPFSKC